MLNPPRHQVSRAQQLAASLRQNLDAPESADSPSRELFERLDDDARAWLLSLSEPDTSRGTSAAPAPAAGGESVARDSIAAITLIRAYRVRGHLEADLDPLKLEPMSPHADLDPASYGFTESDYDRPIFIDGQLGLESATLREILAVLRRDYCGSIGLEFMHMQNPVERTWIQDHLEGPQHRGEIRPKGKLAILDRLTVAERFEQFLDKKYKGTKRFGLDGGEVVIAALEMIVRSAARNDIEDIVIGMSHRGRLNVLANLMEKPLEAILSEFQGGSALPDDFQGAGDVKYHLGTSTDRDVDGHNVHISLTPNPSHLEAVNPVVVGRVRARQDALGDQEHRRSMGLLLHGDAAFAGQGLVPETLQFCELAGYRVGGVVHVIINNQIGFTTHPGKGRSSPYCSDVAKMIQAPVMHVNGDDPEAVVRAAGYAVAYRQAFKKDVVLDVYCYRRHGHNEGDEPAFTQPKMYAKIAKHPTTRAVYAQQLVAEGVISEEGVAALDAEYEARLEAGFEAAESYRTEKLDWLAGAWSGLEPLTGFDARRGRTGVEVETLREVGRAITTPPEGFALNRKIVRQLKRKHEFLEKGEGIDWATAEALAFGTLVLEGNAVRLSGEDCGRGTFSQRHAAWIDQENEDRYVALDHIRDDQARFEVIDSPLSEFGVLGFEYGYSLSAPNTLVLWEAQFGDFANGAQVIFDQFLTSGEEKWLRMAGLVMLLPHGFEGQGPEHSSARLERFLQGCAEENLQVVSCTTPANYFHVLRRQMHRSFRKPLVVMSPKSLLRHKRVVSSLDDIGPESEFHRVLHCDELPSEQSDAQQLVLCSGKVYYDLLEEREKRGASKVHFLRLEQLYPFPSDVLQGYFEQYRHCRLVWCQEEPRNMGAWDFVKELLLEVARESGCEHPMVRYAGRETSASPATGLLRNHQAEQAQLIDEALRLEVEPMGRIAHRKAIQAEQERR
jgi:2-oxoglutarate dehydrogenase E1 component